MTREEKKRIIQILKLILEHPELFKNGLCGWHYRVHYKYIHDETANNILVNVDFRLIQKYFRTTKIWKSNEWFPFYWEPRIIQPRIDFLNEEIERLTESLKFKNYLKTGFHAIRQFFSKNKRRKYTKRTGRKRFN